MIKYLIYYSIVFLFTLLSYSCSNNPVIPPDEPSYIDSNFFEWNTYEVFGTSFRTSMFVMDSNKFIIIGNPFPVYFNKGKIIELNYNDPNFNGSVIDGIDENNIFIGGAKEVSYTDTVLPAFKKFDGINFIDIPIPKVKSYAIDRMYIRSANDIWLSGNTGYIFHYLNQNIDVFALDSGLQNLLIHEVNGTIMAINHKRISKSERIYSYNVFQNNKWIEINSEVFADSSFLKYLMGTFNNIIIRNSEAPFIYGYMNNNWIPLIPTNNLILPFDIDGSNQTNFLMSGNRKDPNINHQFPLIYYNGDNFYLQTNYLDPKHGSVPFYNIKFKYNRFFLIYGFEQPSYGRFSVGTYR